MKYQRMFIKALLHTYKMRRNSKLSARFLMWQFEGWSDSCPPGHHDKGMAGPHSWGGWFASVIRALIVIREGTFLRIVTLWDWRCVSSPARETSSKSRAGSSLSDPKSYKTVTLPSGHLELLLMLNPAMPCSFLYTCTSDRAWFMNRHGRWLIQWPIIKYAYDNNYNIFW